MKANEALVTILKKSHAQALAGKTVTNDKAERFMHAKVYELSTLYYQRQHRIY